MCLSFLKTGKKEKHWSRFWWLSLCSEDYIVLLLWVKNTEVFLALFPEAFFKVLPAWAGTVMENGGFFVQRFWFFHAYIYILYICLQVSWLQLPDSPHPHVNAIKPPFAFLLICQVKCSYDNLKMLCLLNCIYIYIYFLHICAFFFLPKILHIKVAQLMIAFFFSILPICALEILVTFKMPLGNIYLFTKRESQGHHFEWYRCTTELTTSFLCFCNFTMSSCLFFFSPVCHYLSLLLQ